MASDSSQPVHPGESVRSRESATLDSRASSLLPSRIPSEFYKRNRTGDAGTSISRVVSASAFAGGPQGRNPRDASVTPSISMSAASVYSKLSSLPSTSRSQLSAASSLTSLGDEVDTSHASTEGSRSELAGSSAQKRSLAEFSGPGYNSEALSGDRELKKALRNAPLIILADIGELLCQASSYPLT